MNKELLRKKFEKLHPPPSGVFWNGENHYTISDGGDFYAANEYNLVFDGFVLFAAQEIELQLPKIEMSFGREPYPYVDCDNLISGLESKGYKVNIIY